MIDRLYTVFVSSTYKDLKDARRQIIESLWEAGYVPIAMEAQPGTPEAVAVELKRRLKRSDLVVLVIGERYGTRIPRDKHKRSYTRFEYDVALELGCPVIPFVHPDAKTSRNSDLKEFAKLASDPSRHGSQRWTREVKLPRAVVNAVANVVEHGFEHGAENVRLQGFVRVEGSIVPFVEEPRAFKPAEPLFADCAVMIAGHAVKDILDLKPYFAKLERRPKNIYYKEVAEWIHRVAGNRASRILAVCSQKAWGDDELDAYFKAYYDLAKKTRVVDRIFVDSFASSSKAASDEMRRHMDDHAKAPNVTPWIIDKKAYKNLPSDLKKYGDMSGFVLVKARGGAGYVALMVHHDVPGSIHWRIFPDPDKKEETIDQYRVLLEAAESAFDQLKARAKMWKVRTKKPKVRAKKRKVQ